MSDREPIRTTEMVSAGYRTEERTWTYEELLSMFDNESNVVKPLVLRCQSLEAENARLAALVERARGPLQSAFSALKEANSLRNLGFNEHYAEKFNGGPDESGTTVKQYAEHADRIERHVQAAKSKVSALLAALGEKET